MSSKKLDEKNIVNELKGSSFFFQEGNSIAIDSPSQDASAAPVTPPPTTAAAGVNAPSPSPSPTTQVPFQQSTNHTMGGLLHMLHSSSPEHQTPAQSSPFAQLPNTPLHPPTMVGSDERLNERSLERMKVRHSFDILSDQLFALRELAIERERLFGRKVLLGDLVQEALDLFIAKERNRE